MVNEGIEPQKDVFGICHMSGARGWIQGEFWGGRVFCMDIDHPPRNQREVLEPQGVLRLRCSLASMTRSDGGLCGL